MKFTQSIRFYYLIFRQKDFILANVRMKPPKRRRPKNKDTTEIKRTNTKIFHLCDKRVCQGFFLRTLSISNGPLINAFKNKSEFTNFFEGSDQRGRHPPSNKIKQEIVNSIIKFLNEKCIAETTGKFRKKIVFDGGAKSLRNLFDEFKTTNSDCPSYTTFKKIFYENNFSLPQEKLHHKQIKVEASMQPPKIQVHNVEIINPPNDQSESPNLIVTQIPESSASFQSTPEFYEIQFVIPTSSSLTS